MNINEASNMSTTDKMQAWARGQRKENIGAAGDTKLNDFAAECLRLARREPQYERVYLEHVKDIAQVFSNRGQASQANYWRQEVYQYSNSSININAFFALAHKSFKETFDFLKANLSDLVNQEAGLDLRVTQPVKTSNALPDNKAVAAMYIRLQAIYSSPENYRTVFNNFYQNLKDDPQSGSAINTVLNVWGHKYTAEEFGTKTFYLFYNQIHFLMAHQMILDAANKGSKTTATHTFYDIVVPTEVGPGYNSYVMIDFDKDKIPGYADTNLQPSTAVRINLPFGREIMEMSEDDLREVKAKASIQYDASYDVRTVKQVDNNYKGLDLEEFLDFVMDQLQKSIS
jgi:hypothetical protein